MSDTVHYSELGLVNTREMFSKAMAGGYAERTGSGETFHVAA